MNYKWFESMSIKSIERQPSLLIEEKRFNRRKMINFATVYFVMNYET
ncbi:hypothetical protein [Legionella yabuuchiae]|nr:hypothetical protein [Legionella yabuuchiae]